MTVPLADGLKSGTHPQTLHEELVRGAVTERLVQAAVVVEFEPDGDAVARMRPIVVGPEVDFFVLEAAPQPVPRRCCRQSARGRPC
jgi:hypothetical protein